MGKNLIYFLLAIPSLIVIDIFSRFLFAKSWLSNIKLSNEVDPMNIFSTLISAFVAIWLGWYITRKLSAQRFEKEYIISDIKKIEEELFLIEKKLEVTKIDLQTVLELLSRFNLYIDRFSKTIDIFKVTSINATNLSSAYQKLYLKTTNTEGDQLNIDDSVKIEINTICSSILVETRQMIFTINKK